MSLKDRGRLLLRPLVRLLVAMGVSPSAVTLAAIPLSLGSAYTFATGRFFWGGALAALAGLCDTLDGEISRLTGRGTRVGAVLDSVVDRFGESLALAGVAWFYFNVNLLYAALAVGALILSLLVSYVRARAEGAGFDCRVGWFERPVRVIVFLFGAFVLGRTYMPWALGVIAVGSLATVAHRLVHVVRQTQNQ
ncbi:MAG: CDP-alcohol phosphatidyltransferase family protein [candidate division WOR-3 bacterium]|nr:MAG: CDP-alcohol phosphatidyltransferase family protein [candidate division WOR-3 bacterium]